MNFYAYTGWFKCNLQRTRMNVSGHEKQDLNIYLNWNRSWQSIFILTVMQIKDNKRYQNTFFTKNLFKEKNGIKQCYNSKEVLWVSRDASFTLAPYGIPKMLQLERGPTGHVLLLQGSLSWGPSPLVVWLEP